MKKFISMVMAAAMVVSLVPATAFAATGEVVAKSAKVVGVYEDGKDFKNENNAMPAVAIKGFVNYDNAAEVQIKVDDVTYKQTEGGVEQDIVIELDGAVFADAAGAAVTDMDDLLPYFALNGTAFSGVVTNHALTQAGVTITAKDLNDDSDKAEFTLSGELADDAVITFDLVSLMDKTKVGAKAYVTVDTDIEGGDIAKTVYAEVIGETLDVDVDDVVEFAVDGKTTLEKITIESKVTAFANTVVTVKVDKAFEFDKTQVEGITEYVADSFDGNVFQVKVSGAKYTIPAGLILYAETAKAGAEATITVSAKDFAKDSVVVATVLADAVTMSVDEEEDVPEIWNGVNVENYGLDTDCDHKALTVTIKESVAGSWADNKGFTLTLPEGVYAVDGDMNKVAGDAGFALDGTDLAAAYAAGDYEFFKFTRGAFTKSTTVPYEVEIDLTLVADPDFVGDVTLTLEGAALDTQEVVIAKFVAPVVIEAAQNDVVIDYRNTAIPTSIVVKEAEAGLLADDATIRFGIDKLSAVSVYDVFEGDADYAVNEESEMEIKEVGKLGFKVTEQSNEEAAAVTISGIELYMSRDIAAGAYDLTVGTTAGAGYNAQPLFGNDDAHCAHYAVGTHTTTVADGDNNDWLEAYAAHVDADCAYTVFVGDVADYSTVAKEAFINVITAGRDKDDASFTKKVIVPIGENYMIAGEETVPLEVPAYINADNYTMLPVRAVATALGINNNNVLWSQAAKQVTILYGQRIITMTVGEAVVYVNGSAIPATAAVEVVNGRAFLGFRDLANALGVTTIDYVDGKAIMN